MAMEHILQQLNMGTLIEKFREQRMDPSVILSSSDSELQSVSKVLGQMPQNL